METIAVRTGSATVAAFCPFTRLWAVPRFYASLAASDVPFADTHFVAYVDHDDPALTAAVIEGASAIGFAAITVHVTHEAPPHDRAGTAKRRARQAKMRATSVALVPDADLLLLLEDDTTVPANAWERLTAMRADGYDWASGFEVGRWDCPCAGIWRVTGHTLTSMTPGRDAVEDCDATGVYLVLTTPAVYGLMPWDVYDNAWGQDVTVTYLLKRAGYRLGVDWTLECVHMAEDRDWTCDLVTVLKRNLPPLRPAHYTTFTEHKPIRTFVVLARTVELHGVRYHAGQRIDAATANALAQAGLIAR